MIKLQPGDYISTEGMTEEQYNAVCKAFMDAGAEKRREVDPSKFGSYIIWDYGDNKMWFGSELGLYSVKRKLTLSQIINQRAGLT